MSFKIFSPQVTTFWLCSVVLLPVVVEVGKVLIIIAGSVAVVTVATMVVVVRA
jgi:hypothetical protein